jgi:hypothetical protein
MKIAIGIICRRHGETQWHWSFSFGSGVDPAKAEKDYIAQWNAAYPEYEFAIMLGDTRTMLRNINAMYGKLGGTPRPQLPLPEIEHDPVAEFHRQKGCCDGSDPSGCHRRKEAERIESERQTREAARIQRAIESDEYYGTEASEKYQAQIRAGSLHADMSLMCRHPIHCNGKHRMGDKCPDCGFVF